jgi:predicted DNA-binding transcriptional regulator AlpA
MEEPESHLLDFSATAALIGRKANRSTRLYFWRGVKAGTFPAPLMLSRARISWRRSELEAWIASRPRVRYAFEAGTGVVVKGGTR